MSKKSSPEIPSDWMSAMGSAGELVGSAFPFRPNEADDEVIRTLALAYNIPRAQVVRILVHNALRVIGAV